MKIPDIAEYEDTDSELAKYTITNLHHEIEKLKKENKELDKICVRKSHYIDKKDLEITEKGLEIERLNNIINEIEKDIKNLYTYGIKNNSKQKDYLLNRLDGLKALKGEDKE